MYDTSDAYDDNDDQPEVTEIVETRVDTGAIRFLAIGYEHKPKRDCGILWA